MSGRVDQVEKAERAVQGVGSVLTDLTDQEVKGEGSATGGLVVGLCTLVLQLWKMLGGPVSLPDVMEKVIPQDAWGDVGLGIILRYHGD